ncbi:ISL3 family transposase [Nocardia amamiensis]|uniref:ISL3 family transposase n=1 Tax=Nocardia amamiensis TaxID=404578 RepID=UPI0033C53312
MRLTVRRFFCRNMSCRCRTFVEQVAGLTERRRRRSAGLLRTLTKIGLALAGRPGARLARTLAIEVSRTTLLRLVRAVPEPPITTPRILGVDDFALRRGSVYATILVDMDTHRPIDVLPDRSAKTLATWLNAHPGVEIICRDRGGTYADGARTGAPQAIQVADLWHLWHNLAEAVEKTVQSHRRCLQAVPDDASTDSPSARISEQPEPAEEMAPELDKPVPEQRLVTRLRERHAAVHRLRAEGLSLNAIGRELGVCFRTVQRYAAAATPDELLTKTMDRDSSLDPFKPYLHQRYNQGCTNATILHTELHPLGWRGSLRTVQRYLRRIPAQQKAPAPRPVVLKPRHITRWIMTDPANLDADAATRLEAVLARCPELNATARHVNSFADMMCGLHGDRLPAWIEAVQADALPALHSLARGFTRDQAAVTAGLTLPWSSGPVEGQVNRVKHLKRSMFGRAELDLLRRRILLPI